MTYIPVVNSGFLYLAVWMDLFSRKIIGWHLDDNRKEALVTEAFKKAMMKRNITKGLIVHSDRGGQYAGNSFRKLIRSKEIQQSMSRADNPYDNAFMESCFSRFKTELLQDGVFDNAEDAHTEIFEYTRITTQNEGILLLTMNVRQILKRTTIFIKPKQLYCPSK